MKKLSELINTSMPSTFSSHLKIKKAWGNAAGDTISFLTTPGSLKDGTLNIAVHDQMWLSEIGFLKGELLSRLQEHGVNVTNLNFYFKAKQSRQEPVQRRKKEMTDKEKQFADRLVATIDNEDLRKSFRSAIYSYFTRYTLDDYLNC